jgi:hypothetical protein
MTPSAPAGATGMSTGTVSEKQVPPPSAPSSVEAEPKTQASAERPCCAVSLNARIFDWIPVASFILILFLTLFTWVRYAPGGYTLYSQNAWQAAFNGGSADTDGLDLYARVYDDKDTPALEKQLNMNGLTLVYLFLLFVSIGVAVACAAYPLVRPHVSMKIPPQVELFLPWRGALVVLLGLAGIFFLTLQVMFAFSLESKLKDRFEKRQERAEKNIKEAPEKDRRDLRKQLEIEDAVQRDSLRRSNAFTLVYLLQLLALVSSGIGLWLTVRGDKPPLRAVFYG